MYDQRPDHSEIDSLGSRPTQRLQIEPNSNPQLVKPTPLKGMRDEWK